MPNKSLSLVAVPWHTEPVYLLGVGHDLYPREDGFHIFCADWLRREKLDRGWHHSANEANKDMRSRILAKRMMQSPGFPDFVHPRSNTAIELKIKNNQLSEVQKLWVPEFKHYFVCRMFSEFVEAVKSTMPKLD